MFFVYFIKSLKFDFVYVGFTDNIEKRLLEHNNKKTKSTKAYAPLKLIYFEAYLSKTVALKRELELKNSWSKKKQVLDRIFKPSGPVV